jgi:phenylacetate-CoA ligase
MDNILGRSDDKMLISGVNDFPSQLEPVLMEFEEVEPQYQIRLTKKGYIDHLSDETELKEAVYREGEKRIAEITKKISSRIQQVIGINVPVIVVAPDTIERSIGKAKRIIDERHL